MPACASFEVQVEDSGAYLTEYGVTTNHDAADGVPIVTGRIPMESGQSLASTFLPAFVLFRLRSRAYNLPLSLVPFSTRRMPSVWFYNVYVKVENSPLPEYDSRMETGLAGIPIMSCWIPSESGKVRR
jgi:hypothetical protein